MTVPATIDARDDLKKKIRKSALEAIPALLSEYVGLIRASADAEDYRKGIDLLAKMSAANEQPEVNPNAGFGTVSFSITIPATANRPQVVEAVTLQPSVVLENGEVVDIDLAEMNPTPAMTANTAVNFDVFADD